MKQSTALVMLMCFALAGSARAQGVYVNGSATMDIVRLSKPRTTDLPGRIGEGEVAGGAVRIGTEVTDNWGVEFEYAHPTEIISDGVPGDLLVGRPSAPFTRPLLQSRIRHTTASTAFWLRQQFGPRFSLSYLGGIAMLRTTTRSEVSYVPMSTLPTGVTVTLPAPRSQDAVEYGARAVVGIDGRFALTSHLHVIPSLRMVPLEDGWMVRPAAGLGWAF